MKCNLEISGWIGYMLAIQELVFLANKILVLLFTSTFYLVIFLMKYINVSS
jgi:hypothetical protein